MRSVPVDPASYRVPMLVRELNIFWNRDSYYACPRCRISLSREFMSYCDSCGQCLDWSAHHRARITYIFPAK